MKINHDIIRKSSLKRNVMRYCKQRSITGYFLNRLQWNYYPKFYVVRKYPMHVDIELSSYCQLKCPMCFRSNKQIENPGNMTFDTFRKIIDEISGKVFSIKFTGRGEPLINTHFTEFITYLRYSKFGEIAMITNGQLMTEEIMHSIIDNGMDTVSFSIDGLKNTYEEIRKPGKYEDIYHVVTKLYQLRRKKGKSKPLIRIQSVNISVNDERKFLDLWEPISDDIFFLFFKDYSENAINLQMDNYVCPLLYQRIMIHYDGTVPMCINDEYENSIMGNIFEENIGSIWKGSRFDKARKLHLKGLRTKIFKNCTKCPLTRKGYGKG